jgi:amino acid transporter
MLFAYAFDGILPKKVTKLSRTHSPYVAVAIVTVLSVAVLAWAVYVAKSFFTVLTYAVLIQQFAMFLVGLSAFLLPYLRPAMYQACATTRTFLGVPLVSWAGLGAMISEAIIVFVYFHYAGAGLMNKTNFAIWWGATLAAALLFYGIVTLVKRRQGVPLKRVYDEIPPE